jgi:hypothetical protein
MVAAGVTMTELRLDRFDYENRTWAGGDTARAQRWYEELERCGPEDVRARLQQSQAGPNTDIAIGEISMPIGFAVYWLAWCDRQTAKQESRLQLRQLFWPILVTALPLPIVAVWPEVGVPITVLVAAAGWAFTTGRIHW